MGSLRRRREPSPLRTMTCGHIDVIVCSSFPSLRFNHGRRFNRAHSSEALLEGLWRQTCKVATACSHLDASVCVQSTSIT